MDTEFLQLAREAVTALAALAKRTPMWATRVVGGLAMAGLGALLILITSPVVSPRPAHAQVEALETWRCFAARDYSQERALFTLYRYRLGVNGGRVSVAGVSYPAKFSVAGLNRRWDFVLSADGSYTYMFLIKPAGRGLYFDFTTSEDGTATSRAHYTCRSS